MKSKPQEKISFTPVDLKQAYKSFSETWSPRIITQVDNYDVKIAKVEGKYVWHAHEETDEFFLVLVGEFILELEGEKPVILRPLQVFTVPRGKKHRPSGIPGTQILFIELRGTLNSGDADLSNDPWVPITRGVALSDKSHKA
jgi:mannose-6-phosphate isomerase-like protein (cupin superfamily)